MLSASAPTTTQERAGWRCFQPIDLIRRFAPTDCLQTLTTPRYTDDVLERLRRLPKTVTNPNAQWTEKPGGDFRHRQRTFQAEAAEPGSRPQRFHVYLRQNTEDPSDFSCGIVYRPWGGKRLVLARYNGASHVHGKTIRYEPHIHRTTAAAIAADRKPDSTAEATDRYKTLAGALACLIDDYRLVGIRADHDQPELFDGA